MLSFTVCCQAVKTGRSIFESQTSITLQEHLFLLVAEMLKATLAQHYRTGIDLFRANHPYRRIIKGQTLVCGRKCSKRVLTALIDALTLISGTGP